MGFLGRLRAGEEDERERQFDQIVGSSRALESVFSELERVSPTDSTVLVLGETGTGKELIARAIHNLSARYARPFIKLNCAAIPFDLLESELFGHEKGAFTGAVAQKIGRFEMADTGTLFLDEIGDLPLALQPKLLRILQEQEFERLGSGRTHRINVRLVAATHCDLVQMVARNEFRSDLYYRLNVFPVLRSTSAAASRGHSRVGPAFRRSIRTTHGKAYRTDTPDNHECIHCVPLAWKCAGTPKSDRKGCHPIRGRSASQSTPSVRDKSNKFSCSARHTAGSRNSADSSDAGGHRRDDRRTARSSRPPRIEAHNISFQDEEARNLPATTSTSYE